jgi:hypothetical protein
MLKKIGLGLLLCLIIIQFIRPAKNINTVDVTKQITAVATVPENVRIILKKACTDCHSNNTVYPWYSNIQPAYFWLNEHIKEGKREINFDEFAGYRLSKQYRKMEELIEQVNEGEMPLSSYSWIHKDTKVTNAERATLTSWAQGVMDTMKAHYPMDSLVKKKS